VLDHLFTAQLTLDEAARDVGELVAVVAGVSAQHGERLVHVRWSLMVSRSAAAFSLTMATLATCTRA
jgi:hypothetical protein